MTWLPGSIDSLQSAYNSSPLVTIAASTPIALTTGGALEVGISVFDGVNTTQLLGGVLSVNDAVQAASMTADGITMSAATAQQFFTITSVQNTGVTVVGNTLGIIAGTGSVGSGGGNGGAGGDAAIQSGFGGAAGSGKDAGIGGEASVNGGDGGVSDGTGTAGVGGRTTIQAGAGGDGSGSVNPSDGGIATITAGAAGTGGGGNANGGAVEINAGTGSGTGVDGVIDIGLTSGSAVNIGADGVQVFSVGLFTAILYTLSFADNGGQGTLGGISISAGANPTVVNRPANDLHLICGNSGDSLAASTAPRGGAIDLLGGDGGDAADGSSVAGDGGHIVIWSGDAGSAGAGTGATGGRIELRPGTSSDGGDSGAILIGATPSAVPITIGNSSAKIGVFSTTPVVQAAAYTRNATVVEDRTLLASASATTLNNNNVIAALIADLQSYGWIQ